MFTKVVLENFKSFSYIDFDLMETKKRPNKMVFVYGENGSGKSNLMESFMLLKHSIYTLSVANRAGNFVQENMFKYYNKLQYSDYDNFQEERDHLGGLPTLNINELFKSCKTIGSGNQPLNMQWDFILDNIKRTYKLSLNSKYDLISEELIEHTQSKPKNIFSITKAHNNELSINYHNDFITDKEYIKPFNEQVDKYWGKHSLLAILINELIESREGYIPKRISSNVVKVVKYFHRTQVRYQDAFYFENKLSLNTFSNRSKIFNALDSGTISIEDSDELKSIGEALNAFFIRLYSDVKRVYYKTNKEEKGFVNYKLYIDKMMGSQIRTMTFDVESTGTKKLLKIFPLLYEAISGNTVIVDEVDTGIHDLLFNHVIEDMIDDVKGQFIATTHNTFLMKNLKPTSVYIIRIDGDGNKLVDNIKDIAGRTQQNHNNQNRYINGLFDGIPLSSTLDIQEIVETTDKSFQEKHYA